MNKGKPTWSPSGLASVAQERRAGKPGPPRALLGAALCFPLGILQGRGLGRGAAGQASRCEGSGR